jgi:hypothetical protein
VLASLERLFPLAAVPAVVLWIAGVLVLETVYPGDVPGDELVAAAQDRPTTILLGASLFLLGSLCFLWFVGTLRGRLRTADAAGPLPSIAFAGGIVTGVFLIGLPANDAAAALNEDRLTPDSAVALSALGDLFFTGAGYAAAVLVLATSLLALRALVFPRWLAWAGLVVGVVLLIPVIHQFGLVVGFPLWLLAAGVSSWRTAPR